MRKIFLTFSLLLGLFFASCSGDNKPKVVAEKFLKAINKLDFTEAKKYCNKDSQELLSVMESFSKGEEAEKAKTNASDDDFTITKVEEDGDKVKVYYKFKDSDKEIALDLKKIDGKWLISINKEQEAKEQGGHDQGVLEGDDIDNLEGLFAPDDDSSQDQDNIPAA